VKVSGTTSVVPDLGVTGKGDAYAQAKQAFATIAEALRQAGASLADIVQTRMYLIDIVRDSEAVGRAHAELLGANRPAATMVGVAALIDPDMLVEIEVEAIVTRPQKREEEWRLTHRALSRR
jgi:enamine deaminase RidA (YjgF/YER057c/UK114 family)